MYAYQVTGHWSSLAVVESVHGQPTKKLTTNDTVDKGAERSMLFSSGLSQFHPHGLC